MPTLPIIHSRHGSRCRRLPPRNASTWSSPTASAARYERLHSRGHGAVMVPPMLDADTVLLIREYAAGVHRYELGLPKGRIDAGETLLDAANRELKEEAGYGARKLHAPALAHAWRPPT